MDNNNFKNYFNNNFEPKKDNRKDDIAKEIDELGAMVGVLGALSTMLSMADRKKITDGPCEGCNECEEGSTDTALKEIAKKVRDAHNAFTEVGFTDKQAFTLTYWLITGKSE